MAQERTLECRDDQDEYTLEQRHLELEGIELVPRDGKLRQVGTDQTHDARRGGDRDGARLQHAAHHDAHHARADVGTRELDGAPTALEVQAHAQLDREVDEDVNDARVQEDGREEALDVRLVAHHVRVLGAHAYERARVGPDHPVVLGVVDAVQRDGDDEEDHL